MKALAAAGHDVTVVSLFPEQNTPPNYKSLTLTGLEEFAGGIDLGVS